MATLQNTKSKFMMATILKAIKSPYSTTVFDESFSMPTILKTIIKLKKF